MTIQRSPRWRPFEQVSATKLNRMSRRIDELYKNDRTGVTPAAKIWNSRYILLEVKSIDDILRVLTCTLPGMTADPLATEYTVELGKIFTETVRGSITYTYNNFNSRTATNGFGPVAEEITPNVLVNDEILAIDVEQGTRWRMLMEGRHWAQV